MRRCLTVAATLATLALAACGDQPTTTEPRPEFDKGVPCPTTVFPLQGPTGVNAQITALYPAGTLRTSALTKAADIAKKWSQCKVADPQEKVISFINQLLSDYRAGRLIGGTSAATAGKVSTLINAMLAGVGLAAPFPTDPGTDLDFGSGFFTPGKSLLVKSSLGDGGVFLPANAFSIPTAITILRLPPTTNPFASTGETVLPPFFEITASNSQGTHYLNAGNKAIVGFCVDNDVLDQLNQPAIAHIAVTEGTHPGGFEKLDDATAAQFNSLGLTDCPSLPTSIGAAFEGGLTGMADYAGSALGTLLLPRRLEAAVGKTGLGGLATSLSPFGVTDRSPSLNHVSIVNNDPSEDHYYRDGTLDTCHDGCTPEVQILDAENSPVGSGTNVTVSLIQTEGTGGVLSGTLTQAISGEGQSADFYDLSIDRPGTYKLVFSAPGASPATSGEFHVYALAFQTQPAAPTTTIFPGDILGETVDGFTENVVQVKIVDFSGAVATGVADNIQLRIKPDTLSLNGTTVVPAVSGVASFTQIGSEPEPSRLGLTVSGAPEGVVDDVRLEAASIFGEPPVSSDPFTFDGQSF